MTTPLDVNPALKARKALKVLQYLLFALAVLFSLTVLTLTSLTLVNLQRQQDQLIRIARTNETNGQINKANGDRLVDCTTPGGHCYEDSQRRSAEAVETINQVTFHAALCAKSLPRASTEAQMRECITAGLAKPN